MSTSNSACLSLKNDGGTTSYRINPNQTIEKSGPEGSEGRYPTSIRASGPSHGHSRRPLALHSREPVTTTARSGRQARMRLDEEIVYLGEVATFEETAHDQTFTLAVPERSE